MSNYGIATDSLPMFLGNECVIEHFKTLRLKYRDIHRDEALHKDAGMNNLESIKQQMPKTGWYDICEQVIPLDDLLVFIGPQTLYQKDSPSPYLVPLKLVKFRHYGGKTQARIAFEVNRYLNLDNNFIGLDNYVEIFIYRQLTHIEPNTGFGIHIYDSSGKLKYKDGLNLLTNIRRLPIYLSQTTIDGEKAHIFDITKNPQLQSIGSNVAVLQTTHHLTTKCNKVGQHWTYYVWFATACLVQSGKISISTYESSMISDGRKHEYPSYAKGGAYRDEIICTDHVLVINKPN